MLLLAALFALPAPADTTLPHYPEPVQTVTVDGRDLAVYDSGGDGAPVVLVHGLGSNMSLWTDTIPVLEEKGHRVVALDLPGYGLSAKDSVSGTMTDFAAAVAGTMNALDLAQADVVGISMGGQVSMTLALDHPGRVRRLALLSPAGIERFSEAEATMLKGLMTPEAIRAVPAEQFAANVAANFSAYDAGRDGWLLEQRAVLAARPDFPGYVNANAASVAGMLEGPVMDRLPTLAAPTLVVYGADDRLIPNPYLHPTLSTTDVAAQAEAALPDAQVHLVPDAGHLVMLEQPAAVHALLLDFLAD